MVKGKWMLRIRYFVNAGGTRGSQPFEMIFEFAHPNQPPHEFGQPNFMGFQ